MDKKTKSRIILRFLCFIIIGGFFLFPALSNAQYTYTPLEPIPGFSGATDFPAFIVALYKFGIWTVGIAALLMITIGGFMYLTSAGNTSKMDSAKGVITDALIGLIIALAAYLILYVINPDLVKVQISFSPISSNGGSSITTSSGSTAISDGKAGTGKCTPLTTGSCSVSNLEGKCSWDANKASAICNAESGGVSGSASSVDKCTDGKSFSYGLFQINLTCQCKDAFEPKKSKGCVNKACRVVNQSMYNSCVATFTSPESNISKACQIYKSQGWGGWGVNKKCGF